MQKEFINKKVYPKLKTKLQICDDALFRIENASNHSEFSRAWVDFIMSGGTIFSILEQACKNSSQGRQWYGSVATKARKKDPLVKYMVQARNAEEHGIEPVTSVLRGGYSIGVKNHNGQTHTLPSIRITNGQLFIGSEPARNLDTGEEAELTVDFTPSTFHLISVENRGVRYPPPQQHNGADIDDKSPLGIAKIYLQFLKNLVEASKLVK